MLWLFMLQYHRVLASATIELALSQSLEVVGIFVLLEMGAQLMAPLHGLAYCSHTKTKNAH